jgi:hypothetical protein
MENQSRAHTVNARSSLERLPESLFAKQIGSYRKAEIKLAAA